MHENSHEWRETYCGYCYEHVEGYPSARGDRIRLGSHQQLLKESVAANYVCLSNLRSITTGYHCCGRCTRDSQVGMTHQQPAISSPAGPRKQCTMTMMHASARHQQRRNIDALYITQAMFYMRHIRAQVCLHALAGRRTRRSMWHINS